MNSSTFSRFALLGLGLAVAGLSAVGCKKAVEVNHSAYIVGATSDIFPVDKSTEPKIDRPVLNAAVMIATRLQSKRVKFCSGTLIANDQHSDTYRVLTNHHCFAETDSEGKATKNLIPEACSFTTVYFGYTKAHAAEAESTGCVAGSLRTSFDGDLAVFVLQKNPSDQYRPLELWDGPENAEGRTALIVHYPDVEDQAVAPPDGGVALPTASVTMNDCKVIGAFDVSEWDLDRTLPFSIRHTCDLIHGSSGSGLIDTKTGKLLGVNWGGIKIAYENGLRTDNVATKASFAAAFLADNVDEALKNVEERRRSTAALNATNNDSSVKSKSQSLAAGARKSCGVVSDLRDESGESLPVSLWGLFLLLVAPLVLAGNFERKSR